MRQHKKMQQFDESVPFRSISRFSDPSSPIFKTFHPFIFSIIVQMKESGVDGSR